MVQPFIIFVAALPLLFRLAPMILPAGYLESYQYWSADVLNLQPGQGVAETKWRNMGYWKVVLSSDLGHRLMDRTRTHTLKQQKP